MRFFYNRPLLTPTQIKPKSSDSRRNSFFFLLLFPNLGRTCLRFTCVHGRCVASVVLLVPKPSEGADSLGGQLRGDKVCPFSGVTSSGRVWRKVPESDTRGVGLLLSRVVWMSPCHPPSAGRLSRKYAHGIFNMRNDLSTCWAYDSEMGTATRKTCKRNSDPASTRSPMLTAGLLSSR